MALDIAKSRRQRSRLELSTIAATVAERDHETFCRWNRTLVALRDYEDSIAGRLTDGWGHLTDQCYGADFDPERVGPFVDTKAQELFAGALRYFGALSEHDSNQSLPPGSPGATLLFPSEEITVREYSLGRPYPHNFYKQRETLKTKTFKAWDKLGDLVRSRYTRYADLR
jgi:hypothetical protein